MTRTSEVTNDANVIDSREVIERLRFLESDRDDAITRAKEIRAMLTAGIRDDGTPIVDDDVADIEADLFTVGDTEFAGNDWDEDLENEYQALYHLDDDAAGYAPDWQHGATLVRDSYFEDYARELADDIGAIPSDATWPCTCIDWERAARELQQDYTSVEFDGVTYWVR